MQPLQIKTRIVPMPIHDPKTTIPLGSFCNRLIRPKKDIIEITGVGVTPVVPHFAGVQGM